MDALPQELSQRVFAHAAWTTPRAASSQRMAFLGDSVLELAVTRALLPRLERHGPGALTRVRAAAVSGRACREVAEALDLPGRMRAAAPDSESDVAARLAEVEHVLADALEAVIGACFQQYGFEPTAAAVVEAFAEQIDRALADPIDAKSALQERLAPGGRSVSYDVLVEEGPAHEPRFEVVALVDGEVVGRGAGGSKKDAEQEAAAAALVKLRG